MNSEYQKILAKDFNDRLPDTSKSDFVKRIRDEALSLIDPVELTPWLEDNGGFLKPWKFVEGTAESVKVIDVIKSIHLADPEDIYNIVMANRRLEEEARLFSVAGNVEQDAYKLSIYLRNPKAYLESVDMQVKKHLSEYSL